MANHVRQQLRENVAVLLTGLSLTGSHVFQSRVYPVQEGELPCLLISTEEDLVENLTMSFPRRQSRRITLSIKVLAKAVIDLDDVLDEICKEVESVLLADPFLSRFAKDTQLRSTVTGLHGEGERPIGVAQMRFEVVIHTREDAPDVAV
jgi:hypothetical protein